MEIDACIPANDCVRLISQFVEEMDLTALYDTYERMPSEKYASPEIMLKIMLYAYHERKDISSRSIEKNCKRDIHYMYLLEGRQAPDHSAIARFRSEHFGKCAELFLSQMARMLLELEQITTTEVFIDGTKIEASANKYTFVWKKSVTKHQARLLQKTALLVGEIIDRYEMKPLWHKEVKKQHVKKLLKKLWRKAEEAKLEFVSGRGKRKEQLQKDIEDLEAALKKINEYEDKLRRCGNRNSYSKTDPDATFMHMKDDHMMNGQLKPAYNIQHAVNSGFIVAVGVYPNPSDVLTLKPFMEQMEASLEFQFERIVADAGYESEEDFYICHNGKKVEKAGKKTRKTSSGYCREETHYVCRECRGCPYREKCLSGRNWKKPLEKRYKKLIVSRLFEELREEEYRLINSKEGKQLRMNRSIQAEGGFADIKGDSGFTRFLCRGTDNVFAEYVLYAMAHNLGWLHSRIQKDKLDLHLYELKEDTEKVA